MRHDPATPIQAWQQSLILKLYTLACATAWILATVILTACDASKVEEVDLSERVDNAKLTRITPNHHSTSLLFGFDRRGRPDEDAKQYLPFLKYLEEATGLLFDLHFTNKTSTIMDDLGTGKIQFAAIGAGSYIQAHTQYGVIPLVRGLNTRGQASYQSMIVVPPDSPIQQIEQLRGKRFAFGNITSTQGHLIPRIILAKHNILLADLLEYEYTGSHQNCAATVAAKHFDAGGIQDIMGRQMTAAGLLRIIHTSISYPSSGIAANRDVPPDIQAKVKRALLAFKPTGVHAEGLYHWERTEMANGFVEAHDGDYAELRKWSIKFDRLDARARKKKP